MEWLSEGVMVAILGICVVFAVLIFISIILSIFGMASANETKAEQKPIKVATPKPVPAKKAQSAEKVDDKELIAVIMAAIVASENAKGNNIGPDKLVVRSLRRVNGWSKETLHEQQTYFTL